MIKKLVTEQFLSISQAQKELTRLPEQFEEGAEAVTVTRYGKPVLTILPYNTYKSLLEAIDALLETIEILQDKELMIEFREPYLSSATIHRATMMRVADCPLSPIQNRLGVVDMRLITQGIAVHKTSK